MFPFRITLSPSDIWAGTFTDVNKTSIDGLKYVINNGQIAFAWSDLSSIVLKENDDIISIQMKAKVNISDATQIFTIDNRSEFADIYANKFDNFIIKMADVTTISNGKEITISNYPNPFTNSTEIVYSLPESGKVKLILTNVLGQTINTLVDGNHDAGTYRVKINSSELKLTPGIYTYRIEFEGVNSIFSKTNKVICK